MLLCPAELCPIDSAHVVQVDSGELVSSGLKACAETGDLETGMRVHIIVVVIATRIKDCVCQAIPAFLVSILPISWHFLGHP